MLQETIGQRLKFLMESLNLKVRTFAGVLDVSETNIRNYLNRDSKPSSDVLERIVRHYPEVNTLWLITGEGEPFLPQLNDGVTQTGNFNQAGSGNIQKIKGNKGNVVGTNNGGQVSQLGLQAEGPDDAELLKAMIEQLRSQLADKERTIQILLSQAK
jgi:transcriptional regulator with XRE-family HTH domain